MSESIENSDLRRKVENRLQRIANVLLLNASFTENIGLLNGKMGIAIFFYQYGRYSNNKVYTDYAGELIDEILDDNQCLFVNPVLSDVGDVSFNIDELSDAILTIVENKTMRNELAITAYDHLINKFTASRMAEEMNKLFHTLECDNEMMLEYENNERR